MVYGKYKHLGLPHASSACCSGNGHSCVCTLGKEQSVDRGHKAIGQREPEDSQPFVERYN